MEIYPATAADQDFPGGFFLLQCRSADGALPGIPFAKQELHFETSELIIVVLILQIVAIGGAYIFAKLSDAKGNKFSIMVMLVIWIVICFLAYIVSGKLDFYALAAGVGIVMGGFSRFRDLPMQNYFPKI